MEKRASKWLETHSQRHRFLKNFPGEVPRTPLPMSGGVHPPLILSPRSRLAQLTSSFRLQVSPREKNSGSSPVNILKCLATDACLTASPGVAGSIPVQSHTFVELDHEIIPTLNLLPSADPFKKTSKTF